MPITVNGIAYSVDPDSAKLIINTTLNTGKWKAITFLSDTVFETLACNWTGASPTSLTWTGGITVYGTFTQIKLASGSIIAYEG